MSKWFINKNSKIYLQKLYPNQTQATVSLIPMTDFLLYLYLFLNTVISLPALYAHFGVFVDHPILKEVATGESSSLSKSGPSDAEQQDQDGIHGAANPSAIAPNTRSSSSIPRTIWQVFQASWKGCFVIWFNFVITFSVYPGICTQWFLHGVDNSNTDEVQDAKYFAQCCMGVMQLFDTIGRYCPSLASRYPDNKVLKHFANVNLFVVITILRLVFPPLFMYVLFNHSSHGGENDNFSASSIVSKYSLMALMAITNGFCACGGRLCAPAAISNPENPKIEKEEKTTVGVVASFCSTTGILTGSMLGIGLKTWFDI